MENLLDCYDAALDQELIYAKEKRNCINVLANKDNNFNVEAKPNNKDHLNMINYHQGCCSDLGLLSSKGQLPEMAMVLMELSWTRRRCSAATIHAARLETCRLTATRGLPMEPRVSTPMGTCGRIRRPKR